MDGEARKAAVAAYKERTVRAGVYCVRCTATGEAWVGAAPNLDGVENRVRFTLRMGSHRCAALQAAFRTHGEAAIAVETLQVLDPELDDYARSNALKDRLAHWRTALGAEAI